MTFYINYFLTKQLQKSKPITLRSTLIQAKSYDAAVLEAVSHHPEHSTVAISRKPRAEKSVTRDEAYALSNAFLIKAQTTGIVAAAPDAEPTPQVASGRAKEKFVVLSIPSADTDSGVGEYLKVYTRTVLASGYLEAGDKGVDEGRTLLAIYPKALHEHITAVSGKITRVSRNSAQLSIAVTEAHLQELRSHIAFPTVTVFSDEAEADPGPQGPSAKILIKRGGDFLTHNKVKLEGDDANLPDVLTEAAKAVGGVPTEATGCAETPVAEFFTEKDAAEDEAVPTTAAEEAVESLLDAPAIQAAEPELTEASGPAEELLDQDTGEDETESADAFGSEVPAESLENPADADDTVSHLKCRIASMAAYIDDLEDMLANDDDDDDDDFDSDYDDVAVASGNESHQPQFMRHLFWAALGVEVAVAIFMLLHFYHSPQIPPCITRRG